MIIQAPNEILSQKAKPVEKIEKTVLDLIDEMKKQLLSARDPEGVGLAASQVGKPLRLFIVRPTPKSPIHVFINPVIEKRLTSHFPTQASHISRRTSKLEGCLSLPNIWGTVKRSPVITISYLDEKGKKHNRKFTGFMATIIQHEFDHINGILFTQRVLEQKGKLYKSHKNKKGEDVFDEIKI